jgi:AbrB family looped-hinge helix DNA binding protein
VRITSKGQVTIPAELRARFGLLPETEVEFVADRDGVRIVKRKGKGRRETRGERFVRRLRGSATLHRNMSTDELLKLMRGE